jgi:cysteine desulfurase
MIYLDNNATTQPSSSVIGAVMPYLQECYFSASASSSALTGADEPLIDASRAMVRLLNAEEPNCFVFTSGATESNNWIFLSLRKQQSAGRIIISAIEHPSIFEPANELANAGFEVIEIPVNADGVVSLDALTAAMSQDTLLVSVMAANNETGVLAPIGEIGRLIRKHCESAIFHTDATQGLGKIPIDLQKDWEEVDLLSFSAHKFHGPKGIGGLYLRPGMELYPMMLGGGQQNGRRSGTDNTPMLAGLALAASEALQLRAEEIRSLRDEFENKLSIAFPNSIIHSRSVQRLPNTSYFSIPGVDAEEVAVLLAGSGVIVGTGAACSSGSLEGSRTLRSMGVSANLASSALRISLSRFSTSDQLEDFLNSLADLLTKTAGSAVFR